MIKERRSPSTLWVGIIQLDENLNQSKQWRKSELAPFPQLRHPSFLALSHLDTWESSTIIQYLSLMYWIIPPDFLVLQLTDDISWEFSASVRIWANSCNKSLFYASFYVLVLLFWWTLRQLKISSLWERHKCSHSRIN